MVRMMACSEAKATERAELVLVSFCIHFSCRFMTLIRCGSLEAIHRITNYFLQLSHFTDDEPSKPMPHCVLFYFIFSSVLLK
jgi:hypothetical protein